MTRREFLKVVGWMLGWLGLGDWGSVAKAPGPVEAPGEGWGVPWGVPWRIGPAEEVEEHKLLFPLWVNDCG